MTSSTGSNALHVCERRALDALHAGRGALLHHEGTGSTRETVCNYAIGIDGRSVAVVFSERPDNPGTPVANAIERLATKVYAERYPGFDTGGIHWLEHRPRRPLHREMLDRVTLCWDDTTSSFHSPKREPISLGQSPGASRAPR